MIGYATLAQRIAAWIKGPKQMKALNKVFGSLFMLVGRYSLPPVTPEYKLAQHVPQHGGMLMTLAETWLAEGRERYQRRHQRRKTTGPFTGRRSNAQSRHG